MRQLDLFGFFDPPQEDKPEEKSVVEKKEESAAVVEASKLSYSKNTLRSETTTANEVVISLSNEVVETDNVSIGEAEAPVSSSTATGSLFEETSIEEVGSVAQQFDAEETLQNEVHSLEEQAVQETKENFFLANKLPEHVTPNDGSFYDSATADSISQPLMVDEKKTVVSKRKKQTLPELERSGEVIFDDGKITVKIKNRSPFPPPVVKEKKEKATKIIQKRGRKSFKEIDAEVDLIEIPEDEILFQKQYYAISEVAKWFRVNTSLLRFWENEFDVLKPRKNRKGDRLFRPEDVKNLQLIYQLLRQRKYTIDGAKEYIKTNKKKADIQLQLTNTLQKFKSFLLDLKANL